MRQPRRSPYTGGLLTTSVGGSLAQTDEDESGGNRAEALSASLPEWRYRVITTSLKGRKLPSVNDSVRPMSGH
jgi:hypothetical protein